jgi:uncharacterized protein (DUF1330 family)
MTVYAMAQITIHDRELYRRYAARFLPLLAKYEGRLLAADERPRVVEGEWSQEKVILMSFADEASFERWAYSEEYKEISKDRLASTSGVSLLVQGL